MGGGRSIPGQTSHAQMCHPPLACRLQNVTSTVRLPSCRQASRASIVTTSLSVVRIRVAANCSGIWTPRSPEGARRQRAVSAPLHRSAACNEPGCVTPRPLSQGSSTDSVYKSHNLVAVRPRQDNYFINSLKKFAFVSSVCV